MRRKKHKQTRRAVRYYKVHYGFREPFKILLDGNFIHATHEANLKSLQDHIPKLLGGPCKLFVTTCVVKELKSLGKEFQPTVAAAKQYQLHKCGHETKMPAMECLQDALGSRNAEHWWVATQDKQLKQKLSQSPGMPLIFATVNGIHLSDPSETSKDSVHKTRAVEAVPEHELRSEALRDLPQLHAHKGGAKFRRNKAKGPNPLAVKKRQKKGLQVGQATGEKRKRVRRRKGDVEE